MPTGYLSITSGHQSGSTFAICVDEQQSREVMVGNRRSAGVPLRDPWISWNHAKPLAVMPGQLIKLSVKIKDWTPKRARISPTFTGVRLPRL